MRKKIRLHADVYWCWWYFITICVHQRKKILSTISHWVVFETELWKIVYECRNQIPNIHPNIGIDEFIVMPDHVHWIITVGADIIRPNSNCHGVISSIIKWLKQVSSKTIRKLYDPTFVWQKSFYDRIIHTQEQLDIVRKYIKNNPKHW